MRHLPTRRAPSRARTTLLLGLLFAALGGSVAQADVRTEARRHFRHGMQLIQDGSLEEGIAELRVAYDTLPHPNVLYNIARAYADAQEYENALEYFERYLASDPPDREEVQDIIRAVEARVETTQQNTETPPPTVTPEVAPPIEALATPEEIAALEESANQIETLAEATQSDSLRERATRLREVARTLREGGSTLVQVTHVG